MKKLVLSLLFAVSFSVFAQVPQGISYQAIALNSNNLPVVNSNVGLRLSILDGSASGTVLYTETHVKTTNAQGIFNLSIGLGTPVTGTLATINWGTNSKFLKVEMDVNGGTNYVLVGTTQLLSVPYSLMAGGLKMTQAGGSITLTSPNGTQYQLGVTNSGQLTLPTAATGAANFPSNLYMYGSFNNFDPTTAQILALNESAFDGYKYLTAGSQVKFLSSNAQNATVYGIGPQTTLVQNGDFFVAPSSGFYHFQIFIGGNDIDISAYQFVPSVKAFDEQTGDSINGTLTSYNPATNTFTYSIQNVTSAYEGLSLLMPYYFNDPYQFGDFLNDGIIDVGGSPIPFPNATSTPKNYTFKFTPSVNGSGTYTLTTP